MTRVVMVTLTRWDDHGSTIVSQEEADQDVADKVNEGVDPRDREVMHSVASVTLCALRSVKTALYVCYDPKLVK